MLKNNILKIITVSSLTLLSAIGVFSINKNTLISTSANGETPGGVRLDLDPINVDPVAQSYYSGINDSLTGESLKNALYNLIHPNKCTTGYSSIWDYLPDCDVDPNNRNGNNILAFYRGTTTTKGSCNKEHVWPDSRGGNYIEGDPHMVRPTLTSDNSSRGNSCYVEGMNHGANGWDPYADGMTESYRGDAARIIFYCAVQEKDKLRILDDSCPSATSGGFGQMGKLSDLIKWNYEYPISDSERLRNEVLSGETSVHGSNYHFNRNPFIDDRSLVCKIWGNTNSETQRLCAIYDPVTKPTSLTLNKTSLTMSAGQTETLSVSAVTPQDAGKTVYWSSNDNYVASVDNGVVTANNDGTCIITATSTLDSSIKAYCSITVSTTPVNLTSVSIEDEAEVNVGKVITLVPTISPSNAYPRPSFSFSSDDNNVATVTSNGVVTGVSEGSANITVTATQGSINKTSSCLITVYPKLALTNRTFVFKSNASNGSESLSGQDLLKEFEQGNSYVESINTATRIYSGTNGLKFGSGSGGGTLKFSLNDDAIGEITKITVTGSNYSSDSSSFTINGKTGSFSSGTSIDFEYDNLNTDYIQISSSARVYIKSINIYYDSGVSSIPVTGISLNPTSKTLNVGESFTIAPTIAPSNATNKDVTWISTNSAVASVNNGVVSAKASGTTSIKATTVDGEFVASCAVRVNETTIPSSLSIVSSDMPTAYDSGVSHTSKSNINFVTNQCGCFDKKTIQFKKSGGYLYTTTELNLKSIELTGQSGSLTVLGSNSSTFSDAISPSNGIYNLSGYKFFKILNNNSIVANINSIEITLNSGESAEAKAENFAKLFNEANLCGTNDYTSASSNIWLEQKSIYDALDNDTKNILMTGTANQYGSSELEKCLAKYDRVIFLHGDNNSLFPDFMSRKSTSYYSYSKVNVSNFNNNNLVIFVTFVCTSSFIGLIFLLFRKKKKQ